MKNNIKARLASYADINRMMGFYTEAECAYDAIEYIKYLESKTEPFVIEWADTIPEGVFDDEIESLLDEGTERT